MQPDIAQCESGIDYLTLTCPRSNSASAEVYRSCMQLIECEAINGKEPIPLNQLGYAGISCGKYYLGDREEDTIIRATGPAAQLVYHTLTMPGLHISRMDIQVTVWTKLYTGTVGSASKDAALDANRHKDGTPSRKVFSYDSNDGGYTLYVGSRKSASYCRLYNKDKESKQPEYENAWRYEVETHNKQATQLFYSLKLRGGTIEDDISAIVHHYFTSRGVVPIFPNSGDVFALPAIDRSYSDEEAKLNWLAKVVAPTVAKLCKAGYTHTIAQLFGLSYDPPS